jgi:hypothetical protein
VALRRGLTAALAALALARAAAAADPCEEGRLLTGLAVAADAGGLAVAAVDEESAGAASGLRAGDRVVQANASVLTGCEAWARAVREARRERKALLLLVRRGAEDVPLVLAQATWERALAAREAPPPVPPGAPAAPPPASVPPAPPPRRPPPEAPTVARLVEEPAPVAPPAVDALLRDLEAVVPGETPRARIETYQQKLLRVHRQIETLAAREAVPPRVLAGLRTVVRYFDAAQVAWEAEEALRERDDRPRHVPLAEAAAAPYFADSDAEATILDFPFLRETVVREPGTGVLEVSGLWRPVQARRLLWERGREELARLARWARGG